MSDWERRRDVAIHYVVGVPRYRSTVSRDGDRSVTDGNWPNILARLEKCTGVNLPEYDPSIDIKFQTTTPKKEFDLRSSKPAEVPVESDVGRSHELGEPIIHADHVFRALDNKEK